MNITEYRALKAQEQEQQTDSTTKEQPNVQTQQTSTTTDEPTNQASQQGESTPTTSGAEGQTSTQSSQDQTTPPTDFIEIDGQQVPLDELKSGYLRQSDYTRKTQELAREREQAKVAKELYDEYMKDPAKAKQIAEQFNLPYLDPKEAQIKELNDKYHDLLLEKEVTTLQAKYKDFDVKDVLGFAYERKIDNLEDAYHLSKSYKQQSAPTAPATQAVDVEAIKEQLRQDILRELQSNVDTTSIIQRGGDAPVKDNAPVVSNQEIKIARNMGMSVEEYVKWRDK